MGAQDNIEELDDPEIQDEADVDENEGPFLIDDAEEEVVNEAVEDVCVNMNADKPGVQDVPLTVATRSGRLVRRHDYKNLSRTTIQMSQMNKNIKKVIPEYCK